MSSATAQSSGSRLDRSAERKDRLALGLGVLIAHQTEAHLAAVDGLDIGIVVAEQSRSFQVHPGVTAIAENVGQRPHVRPLLVVVGTQHLVGGGVRIARAFDGDFGVLGSAVPPAVIVSQHGRIDDAVLAVNPLDRVGEGAEIGGGGAVIRTPAAAVVNREVGGHDMEAALRAA